MYHRLKRFKESLGPLQEPLYFAKVDVRRAFDTMPQSAVVELMSTVPTTARYQIIRHAEVRPGERALGRPGRRAWRPVRRWVATAGAGHGFRPFPERVKSDLAVGKANTVFVDRVYRKSHDAQSLMDLLAEHVENNLVKVGKRYYRQKAGIPQGSVLSSLLCSYFYADLEARHLGFLDTPDCLLMRLIDDFVVITLDKAKAARFVAVMHEGLPEYNVAVSPEKTLVNFDMALAGGAVPRLAPGASFPYCGTRIDCASLEITKDRDGGGGAGEDRPPPSPLCCVGAGRPRELTEPPRHIKFAHRRIRTLSGPKL